MEGKTRNTGDIASGLALAALGIAVVVQARRWDYLGPDGPGAGFFPLWYGIAMIALSLVVLVSGLRRQSAPAAQWGKSGRALSAWLAFAAAVALSKPIGLLASFALLTFFITAVLYRRPLPVAAAVAAASTLGLYLVFPLLLGMALPVGVLGF